MPDKPKTPQRAIRVPNDRWEAIGHTSTVLGTNRSEIINALIAWYLRERGARLPKRPDVAPDANSESDTNEQQPDSE